MYKSLTTEQAAKLAQALGPEFTAAAKNDLLNFADAVVGLKLHLNDKAYQVAKADVTKADSEAKVEAKADKPKAGK